MWYLLLGKVNWTTFYFAPKALETLKSNVFSPFTNLAIILSFCFDALYFSRIMLWSDYFGTLLVIACTILLAFFSHNTDEKSE